MAVVVQSFASDKTVLVAVVEVEVEVEAVVEEQF